MVDVTFTIRLEQPGDYRTVEELTREAFWNLHVPGCEEHYLAHILRNAPDFLPQLDLVAVGEDGGILGNIMYTRSAVVDEQGIAHETLTFGPLSVFPHAQKQGVGGALIAASKEIAAVLGFSAIIIFGNPAYYHRFGFRPCKEFGIATSDGSFAPAHMALELYDGALRGISGRYQEAPVFTVEPTKAAEFDKDFPPREKFETPTQQEFMLLASQRI